MSEYAKLKNAELENLLKARGLPHTGKKADMVARLQEDDTKSGSSGAAPAASAPPAAEDEIDWGDDAPDTSSKPSTTAEATKAIAATATTEANKTAIAAGGKGPVANPRAVPNQQADTVDPAKTDDLSVNNPAEDKTEGESTSEPAKPSEDFSKGLATTTWQQELEKRKARAIKFGMEFDEEKEKEQLKLVERASKFGGDAEAPKALNSALPERGQKKRGRDNRDEGRHGDRKRGFTPRGNQRGPRRNGDRRNDGRRNENARPAPKAAGGGANWMNEKDRAAAEARKAKWA